MKQYICGIDTTDKNMHVACIAHREGEDFIFDAICESSPEHFKELVESMKAPYPELITVETVLRIK